MNQTLSIRKAENRDIPDINRLLLQVLTVHHNGRPDLFKANCRKYTDQQLQELLCDPERPIFVALDENQSLLGYAFCIFQRHKNDNILTDITTLYIDDLCVEQAARGRQVGRQLYEHVLLFAKNSGCYNVTLNVWSCNPGALAFYQKLGLTPQKIGMEQIL